MLSKNTNEIVLVFEGSHIKRRKKSGIARHDNRAGRKADLAVVDGLRYYQAAEFLG